eukprot:PRCOL_00001071-RA
MATTSKDGSRRANYPILTQGEQSKPLTEDPLEGKSGASSRVKKLVVGFWVGGTGPPFRCALVAPSFLPGTCVALNWVAFGVGDSGLILLVSETGVMIKRDSRGHPYFIVRGEILGFMKDELLRKHLPRMFSLIKNESWGLEDDQIPS